MTRIKLLPIAGNGVFVNIVGYRIEYYESDNSKSHVFSGYVGKVGQIQLDSLTPVDIVFTSANNGIKKLAFIDNCVPAFKIAHMEYFAIQPFVLETFPYSDNENTEYSIDMSLFTHKKSVLQNIDYYISENLITNEWLLLTMKKDSYFIRDLKTPIALLTFKL